MQDRKDVTEDAKTAALSHETNSAVSEYVFTDLNGYLTVLIIPIVPTQ